VKKNGLKRTVGVIMAKKKIVGEDAADSVTTQWPKVIQGSHSTRTEYADGRVVFESDWDKLKADVIAALEEYANDQLKPAVKAKTVRKKKNVEA